MTNGLGRRFGLGAIAKTVTAAMRRPAADAGGLSPADIRALHQQALAAARRYSRQPTMIAAVTGTAGKTSTACFLRQIWARLGHRAAYLGTIGLVTPDGIIHATPGNLTTPAPADLHRILDRLADEGVTHLALEASSHGLDQRRLDGVRLAAGAFTNLSRNHLDYHGSMDAYFEAKMLLFTALLPPGAAVVVSRDAPGAAHVHARAAARGMKTLVVGPGGAIDICDIIPRGPAQIIRLGDGQEIAFPLMGRFQAENALLAAGLAMACGAGRQQALAALAHLKGVPGRLERIGDDPVRSVFVDYAQKPDALAASLAVLRAVTMGRLVLVFGCGGHNDPGKRRIMGAIAAQKADIVIVTDNDPKTEDPAAIRAEILAAAPGAREIADRRAAIRAAVALMEPADTLVVAGKGHETRHLIGTHTYPFSDAAELRAALAEVRA